MPGGPSLANPLALSLVPLLLLLSGLLLREARQRRAFLRSLGDLRLVRGVSRLGPHRLRPVLLSLALTGVIAALARPALAPASGADDRRPLDVVVLLDVSRSMAAEDYAPRLSRLGKAKAMILDTLPWLAAEQVGIVTFAGAPFRQAPLTDDHGALRYILNRWVFIESAPPGGSDIAQGIRAAIRLFGSRASHRIVLLFSDGGQNQMEGLRSALADTKSNGVRIFAFGLGGPVASRLPQYGADGRFSGWLTINGRVATTKLQEDVLREAAAGTGGAYVRVVSGRELHQALDRLGAPRSSSTPEARELFQWALAVALILLALERANAELSGWPRIRPMARSVLRAWARRLTPGPVVIHGRGPSSP